MTIGEIDLPQLQRRDPLVVELHRRGGVLVTGAAGSGTSSTLATIADAVRHLGDWEVHAIHSDGLRDELASNPALRTAMSTRDHESVHRLLNRLEHETPSRPTLVLVDGWAGFEDHQGPINRGAAVDLLVRLASGGRSRGIAVVVAARRRSEVPPELAHALGERIALRCVDEADAARNDGPAELADPDLPAGRAWVRGNWAQVAWVGSGSARVRPDDPDSSPPRSRAPARLPTDVAVDDLPTGATWCWPIGLGADLLGPVSIDLARTHLLIAGPPHSGRSSALRAVARMARRSGVMVVHGSGPERALEELSVATRGAMPTLGVLDDIDEWIEQGSLDDLLCAVLRESRNSPVRLVVAGDATRLVRGYAESVARLRSGRHGIVLGTGAHDCGDVLHTDLRRRDDIAPSPGRGWIVDGHEAVLVQLARIRPSEGPRGAPDPPG